MLTLSQPWRLYQGELKLELNKGSEYTVRKKIQLYDIDVTFKYGKVMEIDMKV